MYLKLLIFLPEILVVACDSSSLAFLMMYSAYKLNKQGDNIQPWCTPFLILNQFVFPYLVLTVASWPACKFSRRQMVWYSHLFYNFPQFVVIHTVKGFSIVNKAEIRCFSGTLLLFWWSNGCWQFDNMLVPLPFLNPAWTSGSSWFTYYWRLAWRILSITLLVCEMSAIVR